LHEIIFEFEVGRHVECESGSNNLALQLRNAGREGEKSGIQSHREERERRCLTGRPLAKDGGALMYSDVSAGAHQC